MKKFFAMFLVGAVFLSGALLPLARAVEGDVTAITKKGTPEDFSDLEKTLKRDKFDNLERRVSDLEQANRFLTQRMQDLERTVYDFKSRT